MTSDVCARFLGFWNSRRVAFHRKSRVCSSSSGCCSQVCRISVYMPNEVMQEGVMFSKPASVIRAKWRATTVMMVSTGTTSEW